jgi:hypothetical protein
MFHFYNSEHSLVTRWGRRFKETKIEKPQRGDILGVLH